MSTTYHGYVAMLITHCTPSIEPSLPLRQSTQNLPQLHARGTRSNLTPPLPTVTSTKIGYETQYNTYTALQPTTLYQQVTETLYYPSTQYQTQYVTSYVAPEVKVRSPKVIRGDRRERASSASECISDDFLKFVPV